MEAWLEAVAQRLPIGAIGSPAIAPMSSAVPIMIGIDGPSGAGKSTMAGQLRRFLAGRLSVDAGLVRLIRMDHLYPGWAGLDEGSRTLAQQVLPHLARAQPGRYRRWDWLRGCYSERTIEVHPAPYVIAEGVGSCARACAPFLTVQIWADAPQPVRYSRAMARDGDTYRPHWSDWALAEQRHFDREATKQRADLHVTT
jgi:hypothetical protein